MLINTAYGVSQQPLAISRFRARQPGDTLTMECAGRNRERRGRGSSRRSWSSHSRIAGATVPSGTPAAMDFTKLLALLLQWRLLGQNEPAACEALARSAPKPSKYADQQQAEVATRRQARAALLRIERLAQPLRRTRRSRAGPGSD
jgi:hypothetical protein